MNLTEGDVLILSTVNWTAGIASQCEPGQVCVGVPLGDGDKPPDPGPSVDIDVIGVKQLKGISTEMVIFDTVRVNRVKKKNHELIEDMNILHS